MSILAFLSTQVIDTTTVGRAVMTAVDAAAARTAIGAQPLDADLTALAALTGTNNIYYRSAADTWSSVTIGTGLTFTGGTLAASGGAGISGSTGAVDNAVLRADGTGGSTLQTSAIVIPDNFTASPNNTVNHASIQATGGTTNVSVSLVPKGSGSFSLHVPDATATGGNARGANAVDLQTSRSAATQVAAGIADFQVGANNTTNANYAATFGQSNSNTGQWGFVAGQSNTNSGNWGGVFGGFTNTANQIGAVVVGGIEGSAFRRCMRAFAANAFASAGDCQGAEMILRCNTTTDAAVEMQISGNTRLTIPSGRICHYTLIITGVRQGGADVAYYLRRVVIKNIGGTVSLVGSVDTIGTDVATGTLLSVTADNTNKSLNVSPTGVLSQNWRWNCIVYGGEIVHQ